MNSMIELTSSEWALYEERYGKLMHKIAWKISGDDAIASHEDNYADLCLAALESIEGFYKKTGERFKEAIDNKLFDQYTKTVLWNRKAKKGIPLSKKMDFRKSHVSLDVSYGEQDSGDDLLHCLEDRKAVANLSSIDTSSYIKDQEPNVRKVMDALISDPSMVQKNGVINLTALSRPTGLSVYHVKRAVGKIKKMMSKDYVK